MLQISYSKGNFHLGFQVVVKSECVSFSEVFDPQWVYHISSHEEEIAKISSGPNINSIYLLTQYHKKYFYP